MRIEVDCERIRANAAAVTELCARHGIEVAGVTKCVRGEPEVARAMLAGGCTMLADSRLDNVARMRDAGIEAPILLLRLPALSEVDDVVRLCDLSLVSEVETRPRPLGRGEDSRQDPRGHRHGRERRPPRGRHARGRGRRLPRRSSPCRASTSPASAPASTASAASSPRPRTSKRSPTSSSTSSDELGIALPPRLGRPQRQPAPRAVRSRAGALQPLPRRRGHPHRHRLLDLGRPAHAVHGHVQGLRRGHRGQGQALGAGRHLRPRRLHGGARVAGPRRAAQGDRRPRRDRPAHVEPQADAAGRRPSSGPAPTTSCST